MSRTYGQQGEIIVQGAGLVFRTETAVINQTIASGQTGDLVTIGASGKTTKLTMLSTNTVTSQAGIGIDVDGVELISDTLSDYTIVAGSGFYVGAVSGATGAGGVLDIRPTSGEVPDIYGEFITIKKDAGNTAQELLYSYVTGVIK